MEALLGQERQGNMNRRSTHVMRKHESLASSVAVSIYFEGGGGVHDGNSQSEVAYMSP